MNKCKRSSFFFHLSCNGLITIKGIVSAIKLSSNPAENAYAILSTNPIGARCEMTLELGDTVEVKDSAIGSEVLRIGDIKVLGKASKAEYRKMLNDTLRSMGIKQKTSKAKAKAITQWMPEELSKTTIPMLNDIGKAAVVFSKAFVSGAPIIIRFHNDCDGSSGAISIYRALRCVSPKTEGNIRWQMNKSVAYEPESAQSDLLVFNGYMSMEKPLVLIVDFGTTEESINAINCVDGKCDLVWLDHHPPPEKFPKERITNYINPWDYGGDSDYSAGFLGGVFAQALSGVDVKDLQLASLIGDFSRHADMKHEKAQRISTVLDFVTSNSTRTASVYRIEKLTPRYMDALLDDNERFDSFYRYATNMMDDALEAGVRTAKHYKTKASPNGRELAINIYVMDFKHVRNEAGYPLPGRYSSKLQAKLELLSDGETMTVVHYGNYISIRMTKGLAKEFPLHDIVKRLKESSEYVHSGGGHAAAGGIKIDEQHAKSVIKLLLREFGIIDTNQ